VGCGFANALAKSPPDASERPRPPTPSPKIVQSEKDAMSMQFLINGTWRDSAERIEIRAPFDNAVIGSVFQADKSDVAESIVAAVSGFERMRQLTTYERAVLLHRMSEGVARRADDLARTIAAEAGKPIKAARVEVGRSIFTFTVAAEETKRIEGDFLPLDLSPSSAGRFGIVRRFPIGPITGITPFNFPLNLVAHKVAPALAAGNAIIIKPAPQTPMTALKLAEIAVEAGVPPGALQVVPCAVENAEPLITDERIKMLTFTGSPAVGWKLKAAARKKKVVLELGGNAGVIVHSDANLDFAASRIAQAGFGYAGQTCISVQRVFVHRPVMKTFLEKFVPLVKAFNVGDPFDENTDIGPVVSLQNAERIETWIAEAEAAGAKILLGGKRRGRLVPPTILTNTDPEMRVNCREIFGPVVTVEAYNGFEKAIEAVNASTFGLQAGLFTNDMRAIFKAYEALEVGGVIVGDAPTFRVDHMPYGGVKDSGFGREGVKYAIEEMTEPKLLVINQGNEK
jgi:glyceraldehyde-3-phosphate dehydrogenase (NADP+)